MNNLTKNIQWHLAFDDDLKDNLCLYCQGECNLYVVGTFNYVKRFNCQKCKEYFDLQFLEDTPCKAFGFSCKNIKINIFYETENLSIELIKRANYKNIYDTFMIGTRSDKTQWISNLNDIEISFDDKEKLYNQFKVYTLFS